MHDRRIQSSKANIDHLVVTRGGVWVMGTKRPEGNASENRVVGGTTRPQPERGRAQSRVFFLFCTFIPPAGRALVKKRSVATSSSESLA